MLASITSHTLMQTVGWVLIHFLWQGTALAFILLLAMAILRKAESTARYNTACITLLLMVLAPITTALIISGSSPEPNIALPAQTAIILEQSNYTPQSADIEPSQITSVEYELTNPQPEPKIPFAQKARSFMEPALPFLTLGWIIGVAILSIWHLSGWGHLQSLKRRMNKPAPADLCRKMDVIAKNMGVKKAVRLLESVLIDSPAVIGFIKPVILLPACALTCITPQQLETIIAHELAHIKRNDYLVNLLQTAVEILGFYHPAVWWVSHRIRVEREICCDDMAIAATGDSLSYAGALVNLEENRGRIPDLAVAAHGGNFRRRISRLLKNENNASPSKRMAAIVTTILLIAITVPTVIAINQQTDEEVTAAQLVNAVHQSENWIHDVDSLYMFVERKFTMTDEHIERLRAKMENQTILPKPGPGMLMQTRYNEDYLKPESKVGTIEYAFEKNRIRIATNTPGDDISTRIWDGQNLFTYYKTYNIGWEAYTLDDEITLTSFKEPFRDLYWLRSQYHSFWCYQSGIDKYALSGRPEDYEIVGTETYKGHECYVLENLLDIPKGDEMGYRWYVGKDDKLLYGMAHLRKGIIRREHWTLDYKEVSDGCFLPMTQGSQSYEWDEQNSQLLEGSTVHLKVTEVRINEVLPDSLYEMELKEGIRVYDDRFGNMIEYDYDSSQTEEQLQALINEKDEKYIVNLSKDLTTEELIDIVMAFRMKTPVKLKAACYQLCEIGSPAVPLLIERLEGKCTSIQQSLLAFNLRAIGDKQAVPALIDSLEIAGHGSYGLQKTQNVHGGFLDKFWEKHQVSEEPGRYLHISGPKREINAALETITGHWLGISQAEIFESDPKELAEKWRQWLENAGDSWISEEEQKIQDLLEAVGKSLRPAANMQVSWNKYVYGGIGMPGAFSVPTQPGQTIVPWPEIKLTVDGNRTRLERVDKIEKDNVEQIVHTETAVFDGSQYKKLKILAPKEDGTVLLYGHLDDDDKNILFLNYAFSSWPIAFCNPSAKKYYRFELQQSPAEGIYVLDAVKMEYNMRLRFTIDGNRGFNVIKVECIREDGTMDYAINYRLKEYASGLWYLSDYEMIRFSKSADGSSFIESQVVIKDIKFDVEVNDEMFRVEFPDGTMVHDKITDKIYTTDETTAALETITGHLEEEQKIQKLLGAVSKSLRPAANMQVSWYQDSRISSGARTTASRPVKTDQTGLHRQEMNLTVDGNRSRLERNYKIEKNNAMQVIRTETAVFDGILFKRLKERSPKEDGSVYRSGYHHIEDKNLFVLNSSFSGWPVSICNPRAKEHYAFELQQSPAEGIYVLDAVLKKNKTRKRFTIDGNRGFNVVKVEGIISNGTIVYETNFRLKEYEGGLWYLSDYEKIRFGMSEDGSPYIESQVVIKEIKFDVDVNDEMFRVEFPDGIQVQNGVTDELYKMGDPGHESI